MIDCPECGASKSVSLHADAVARLDAKTFEVIETNTLDNSWLACDQCFASSDKYECFASSDKYSDALWKIWKDL